MVIETLLISRICHVFLRIRTSATAFPNILIYDCSLIASGGNPFHNVEKTSVLQEARIFNETPVNARRCTHVLTKILYLINQVGHT